MKRKNEDILLEKQKNEADRSYWLEFALVLLILFVITIVVLALMGPVIGNIFSNLAGCTLGAQGS